MARGRRKTGRRSRPKADWVYRSNARLLAVGTTGNDQLGTYEPTVSSQNGGIAAATSHILYDSRDYLAYLTRGGVGSGGTVVTQGVMGGWARAEGRKACIRAVQGYVYIEPQSWTLGNVIAVGIRIGVFEQDLTGVFSLDADYSMWQNAVALPSAAPAHWANNTRNNAFEGRWWKNYGDASTTPLIVARINWRGRKYLEGYECFGAFCELGAASIGVRMQWWLRSLVEDEG